MRRWFGFVLLVMVVSGGCIWIDDEDDGPPCCNLDETVIYINRTGFVVDNIIDDQPVGSVGPDETLTIVSPDLDGQHEYTSFSRDGSLTWGPTYFTLRDGEVFRIYLETSGSTAVFGTD
ncbi:hypothetical protein JXA80_06170 [bacterium]|nr:hypothetical protein [candidate division CSSED10-310 bacterium]